MSKNQVLELIRLRQQIISCQRCTLSKRRLKAVPDNANLKSKIVAVGEAPGRVENRTGYPFVGPSGNFLRNKMALSGIDFDSMYITNVCKCYPNDCRTPLRSERLACRYYLLRQIEAIQPKLIIPIGGLALTAFTAGPHWITKEAGKMQTSSVIEGKTWPLFPINHPAYIMRRRKLMLGTYLVHLDALRHILTEYSALDNLAVRDILSIDDED